MNTFIKSNIISKRSINVLWAQIILLKLPGAGGVAQLESTHLHTQSPGFYCQQNGIPTETRVWDLWGGGRKIRSTSSGSVIQQVLGQPGLHKTLPQTEKQTQPRLLHVTHGLLGKHTTLTHVIDAEAALAINVNWGAWKLPRWWFWCCGQ